MFATTTIADEILELKKQRRAILLAHHYQEPEVQELADVAVAESTPRMEGNQMHTILSRRPQSSGGKVKPAATSAAR